MTSALGAIQVGSSTAFSDLVGSFIVLSTVSYGKEFLGSHRDGWSNERSM